MKIPRLETLDVLRGFALLGIFITHLFSVVLYEHEGYSPKVTAIINITYLNLLSNKFFTIFSFLFGLSFHIQFQNSLARRSNFSQTYIWRLAILFVIGSLHFFFYVGDILQAYALLGLLLLSSRNLKGKTLLLLSLLFFLLSIIIPALGITRNFNIETSILTSIFNAKIVDKYNWYLFTDGRLYVIATFFYLGFYIGKTHYFLDVKLGDLKKLLLTSITVATISTGVLATIYLTGARRNPELSYIDLFITIATRFQQISLTFTYIAIIVMLHKFSSQRFLNFLIPIGKMGLTFYILQSLFIYMTHDWLAANGLLWALTIGFGSFILLSPICAIWMLTFKSGPLEWIWKKSADVAVKVTAIKQESGPQKVEPLS